MSLPFSPSPAGDFPAAQAAAEDSEPSGIGVESGSAGSAALLLERVESVGEALRAAFSALHASMSGEALGPKRLAERLGEPVPIASRLLRALAAERPIECVLRIPGPDPLERWVRAARRRGADPGAVRDALAGVADFQRLIADEAGDRARLDALISHWVPGVRQAVELRRRQAVFRGLSELHGMSAELELSALLLHPSPDGRSVDICSVQAVVGVVALRPGVRMRLGTERDPFCPPADAPTCLDGRPSLGSLDGLRLDDFCPSMPGRFRADRIGDRMQSSLEVDGLGPKQPAGAVIVEVTRRALLARPSEKGAYFYSLQQVPARRTVFDLFLHRDLAPADAPALHFHSCVGDRAAEPRDPLREIDRLDVGAAAQAFGGARAPLPAAGLPRYRELLDHVTDKLGWTDGLDTGYRAELEFPTPGTQLTLECRPAPFGVA